MTQTLLKPIPNPFATRYVRPGAIPFVFPPAIDAAAVVALLRDNCWLGSIVGPHGSGKSTLLESLRPELRRAGRHVLKISLHDGQRALPSELLDQRPWDADAVLIIDGYEQLSAWNRGRLARLCGRDGCGLVVTSHRPTRWPEIYRTEVNCELFERIVERLLAEQQQLIVIDDVRQAFSQHGENLREALFALYDLHESRSRLEPARL